MTRCPKCGLETCGQRELQFHVPRCGNMVDEFGALLPQCLMVVTAVLIVGGLFAAVFGN